MADARTFLFEGGRGKLVYDGYIAENKAFGADVKHRILSEEERLEKLREKLEEELAERAAAKTPEERQKEERDVMNIRFALGEDAAKDHTPSRWFTLGTFAVSITLPTDPNNKEAAYWIEYYASQPDRFPEVTE